jgi:hypothetical protein
MGVAFDAAVGATWNGAGAGSHTHTPSGNPAGVLVGIASPHSGHAGIYNVRYGTKHLTGIRWARQGTSEFGYVQWWFCGGPDIPTGNQTVAYETAAGLDTTTDKRVVSVSLTSDSGSTYMATRGGASGAAADPAVSLSTIEDTWRAALLWSGNNSTASVTPLSGHTDLFAEASVASGAETLYGIRRDATTTGAANIGWTATSEDYAIAALAIADGPQPLPDVDAKSTLSFGTSGTGPTHSWTHTPVGTARGIVVAIQTDQGSDVISTVTYGGVSMSRVAHVLDTATEPGGAYIYFLGSGIPTGAQTVAVTRTSTGAMSIRACCISLKADNDTYVVTSSTQGENASISIATDAGQVRALRVLSWYTGFATPGNYNADVDHGLADYASFSNKHGTTWIGYPVTGSKTFNGPGSDDLAAVYAAIATRVAPPFRRRIAPHTYR